MKSSASTWVEDIAQAYASMPSDAATAQKAAPFPAGDAWVRSMTKAFGTDVEAVNQAATVAPVPRSTGGVLAAAAARGTMGLARVGADVGATAAGLAGAVVEPRATPTAFDRFARPGVDDRALLLERADGWLGSLMDARARLLADAAPALPVPGGPPVDARAFQQAMQTPALTAQEQRAAAERMLGQIQGVSAQRDELARFGPAALAAGALSERSGEIQQGIDALVPPTDFGEAPWYDPTRLASGIVENAPQLAAQALLTRGLGAAGVGGGTVRRFVAAGVPMQASQAMQAQVEGRTAQGASVLDATVAGAPAAALDAALNSIVERLTAEGLLPSALTGQAKQSLMRAMTQGVVAEGVQETGQEAISAAIEAGSGANPDAMNPDNLVARLGTAAVTGGVLGGAMRGIGELTNRGGTNRGQANTLAGAQPPEVTARVDAAGAGGPGESAGTAANADGAAGNGGESGAQIPAVPVAQNNGGAGGRLGGSGQPDAGTAGGGLPQRTGGGVGETGRGVSADDTDTQAARLIEQTRQLAAQDAAAGVMADLEGVEPELARLYQREFRRASATRELAIDGESGGELRSVSQTTTDTPGVVDSALEVQQAEGVVRAEAQKEAQSGALVDKGARSDLTAEPVTALERVARRLDQQARALTSGGGPIGINPRTRGATNLPAELLAVSMRAASVVIRQTDRGIAAVRRALISEGSRYNPDFAVTPELLRETVRVVREARDAVRKVQVGQRAVRGEWSRTAMRRRLIDEYDGTGISPWSRVGREAMDSPADNLDTGEEDARYQFGDEVVDRMKRDAKNKLPSALELFRKAPNPELRLKAWMMEQNRTFGKNLVGVPGASLGDGAVFTVGGLAAKVVYDPKLEADVLIIEGGPGPMEVYGLATVPVDRESVRQPDSKSPAAAAVQANRAQTRAADQERRRPAQRVREGMVIREQGRKAGRAEGVREGLELAAKATAFKPPTLKQRIATATGIVDAGDQASVSKRDALRGSLARQVQAAREADRAARAEALDELEATLADGQLKRERVAALVKKLAPPELAVRFLRDVATVDTERRVDAVATRVLKAVGVYRTRAALDDAKAAASRVNERKMLEELRSEVVSAKGELVLLKARVRRAATLTPEALRDLRGDLVEVRNRLLAAATAQRNYQTIRVDGKAASRAEVVAAQLEKVEKRPDLKTATKLPMDAKTPLLRRVVLAMMNRDTVAALLGDGAMGTMLTDAIWKAERLVYEDVHQGSVKREEALTRHGFKAGSQNARELTAAATGDDAKVFTLTLPSGRVIKATGAEMMGLYAVLTDQGARRNILRGAPVRFKREAKTGPLLRLTRADIEHVERTLDPKLRAIVDDLKADYEARVSPGERASYREHFGFDMERVKGYVRTERSAKAIEAGMVGGGGYETSPSLNAMGAWKARDKSAVRAPYFVSDFLVLHQRMVFEAAARTHMNQPVRSLQSVLRDEAIESALTRKFGRQFVRKVRMLADASTLIMADPPRDAVSRATQKLKRNLSTAFLTLSPSPVLKNLGGVLKLLADIDAPELLAALPAAADPRVYKRMIEASAFLRERHENLAALKAVEGVTDGSDVAGKASVLSDAKAARIGDLADRLPFFAWGDSRASVVAFRAGEMEAKAKGLTGNAAQRYAAESAERVIRRTQNPGGVVDQSIFSQQTRGTAISLLTQFTSDGIASANMLMQAGLGHGTVSKQFGRTLAAVSLNNAWAAAVTAGLGAAVPALTAALAGNDDEELRKGHRDFGETFAREFLANTAGLVYGGPALYEMAESLAREVFTNKPARDVDLAMSPVGRTVTDMVSGVIRTSGGAADWIRSEDDKAAEAARERTLKGVERMALSGVSLAGVPAAPAYALVKRGVLGATDGPDPGRAVDVAVAALKAGKSQEGLRAVAALVARGEEPLARRASSVRQMLYRRGPFGSLGDGEFVQSLAGLTAQTRRERAEERRAWRREVDSLVGRAIGEAAQRRRSTQVASGGQDR